MNTLMFLMLFSTLHEYDTFIQEDVYSIELNCKYNENTGELYYKQVIFYELIGTKKRIITWRYTEQLHSKHNIVVNKVYHPDTNTTDYCTLFYDVRDNKWRDIRAKHYEVTHTTYDVEAKGRDKWPEWRRKQFKKSKKYFPQRQEYDR